MAYVGSNPSLHFYQTSGVLFHGDIKGQVVAMGRTTADADATYLTLQRNDGTSVYVTVPTGTSLVVATTQP